MRTFGDLFLALIKAKYRNQTQFAYAVGNDNGYVSKIINGESPAPTEELLQRWARALDLSGPMLDDFLFAADLTHVTERIAKRVASLDSLVDDQTQELDKLRLELKIIREALATRAGGG